MTHNRGKRLDEALRRAWPTLNRCMCVCVCVCVCLCVRELGCSFGSYIFCPPLNAHTHTHRHSHTHTRTHSHPPTLTHTQQPDSISAQDPQPSDPIHPHADTIHPHADTIHPHADTIHPHADTMHPHADTIHPHADTIHPRADTTTPSPHDGAHRPRQPVVLSEEESTAYEARWIVPPWRANDVSPVDLQRRWELELAWRGRGMSDEDRFNAWATVGAPERRTTAPEGHTAPVEGHRTAVEGRAAGEEIAGDEGRVVSQEELNRLVRDAAARVGEGYADHDHVDAAGWGRGEDTQHGHVDGAAESVFVQHDEAAASISGVFESGGNDHHEDHVGNQHDDEHAGNDHPEDHVGNDNHEDHEQTDQVHACTLMLILLACACGSVVRCCAHR